MLRIQSQEGSICSGIQKKSRFKGVNIRRNVSRKMRLKALFDPGYLPDSGDHNAPDFPK